MSFEIIGTGHAVPDYILTNEELTGMLETSDQWIRTRTGIQSRRISTTESLSDLAAAAGKKALRCGEEPDLIICSTVRGDFRTPSLACLVQKELSLTCPAFDANAACSGFVYALDIAAAYLDSGRAKKILVIAAEAMSKQSDWGDRTTCVLFGDGAGAVMLKKGDGLLAMRLTAVGNDKLLSIPNGEGNSPFATKENLKPYLQMAGAEVFKFAVQSCCTDVNRVLLEAGLTVADIKKFIPHQANLRIISAIKERLGFSEEQVVVGIDRFGNTSSASIPILLDELMSNGQLSKGDHIVLSAFGGGLTTGACVIKL